MSEMHCLVPGFPAQAAPQIAAYRELFHAPADPRWAEGGGGATFTYAGPDGEFTLTASVEPFLGISLMLNDDCERKEWFSIGNPQLMNDFVRTEYDLMLPQGSFLEPAHAWLVVESFLKSPATQPPEVQWKNSGELIWPEP